MEHIAILLRWGAPAFIAALLLIVIYKVLAGEIRLDGLLTGRRRNGTEYLSLGRTQLVLITLITAALYIKEAASNPGSGALPRIPNAMLEVLGGSQLFYLAGKTRALFSGPDAESPSTGKESQ